MKRNQTGEVVLAVMVIMLAVMWLGRGHMGMMGGGHAEHTSHVAQQEHAGTAPAARESGEPQH